MIQYTETELKKAHKHSIHHEPEIRKSCNIACFFCQQAVNLHEIKEWVDKAPKTALCPHCGIDSVIGDASGYLLTPEFLSEMHNHWFGVNK